MQARYNTPAPLLFFNRSQPGYYALVTDASINGLLPNDFYLYTMSQPKGDYINRLLHFLIWSLVATLLFLFPTLSNRTAQYPPDFTIKQLVHLCLMVASYYINAYVFVPHLLFKKKYVWFGLVTLIFVLISAYILAMVETALQLPLQMEHIWGNKRSKEPVFDRFGFFTTLITLGISTNICAINKMNRDNKDRLALERERIASELSFLKAQIHPHFFFNTLNSIYALSFTNADASRKVLTQLSQMMRYLLYETQQNATSLNNEISFVKNYVDIMKHRLNQRTELIFEVPEEASSFSIAPMLLMPYIENVFKHGIDDQYGNVLLVKILYTRNGIRLVTKNKVVQQTKNPGDSASKGIGMQNTLRRLELTYKNKYQLVSAVLPATNEFELTLEIELT